MPVCRDLLANLGACLDDEVPPALRRDIEEHLAGCRACAAMVESTGRIARIVGDSRAFDLPAGMSARVVERLRRPLAS